VDGIEFWGGVGVTFLGMGLGDDCFGVMEWRLWEKEVEIEILGVRKELEGRGWGLKCAIA